MRNLRISLAAIVLCLIGVGVLMIYSSSGVYARQELNDGLYFLKRHIMFLMIGMGLSLGVLTLDYRQLRKVAKPLLIFSLLLLVLVLIPGIGRMSFGARRWFQLGPFFFQPSELAKLALLIYLADYCARKGSLIKHFMQGFVPPIGVMGLMGVFILKQPDLGSTLMVIVLTLLILFLAGARWQHLALLGLGAVPFFYLFVMRVPYRWRRIVAFLDPWQDSQGAGFQLTQSQIAFGSGGIWGVGPGKSMQKLFYLPAAHTDFIFSIIGEEFGIVGCSLILFLFAAFIWQGFRIAKRTQDPFGYFLCLGLVSMIGIQAVVNVGVSIGALPTKGLPLPFISYGGSALIFNLCAVALILNISRVEDLSA